VLDNLETRPNQQLVASTLPPWWCDWGPRRERNRFVVGEISQTLGHYYQAAAVANYHLLVLELDQLFGRALARCSDQFGQIGMR
jgi:hypothetical protein